jgi:hypothetical protein
MSRGLSVAAGVLTALVFVSIAAACAQRNASVRSSSTAAPAIPRCILKAQRLNATASIGVIIATVPQKGGKCAGRIVLRGITKCIAGLNTTLLDPGAVQQVQDCLHASHPNAVVTGGRLPMMFDTGPGWWGSLDIGFGEAPVGSCSSGVNGAIAEGEEGSAGPIVDTLWTAAKAVVITKVFGAALDNALTKQQEALTDFDNGGIDETKYDDARQAGKQVEDSAKDVEAFDEATPSPTRDGGLAYVVVQVIDWFSHRGSSDESGSESGGSGTESSGGGSEQPAQDAPCKETGELIQQCALEHWATSPCKLLLHSMQNPRCNSQVALTDGDDACAGTRPSKVQLERVLARAKIECQSRIHPSDPNGSVCGVRTPEGTLGWAWWRTVSPACGPQALTTEASCSPKILSPAQVVAKLTPRRAGDITNIVLGIKGVHPPGPPPKQ